MLEGRGMPQARAASNSRQPHARSPRSRGEPLRCIEGENREEGPQIGPGSQCGTIVCCSLPWNPRKSSTNIMEGEVQ